MTEQRTILVVEDDEPTQKLLQAVLLRAGFRSEIAPSGSTAISLLREKEYAAVVLDMMMPEVSGRDVIDFLGTAKRNIPVLVCSAAGPAALAGLDPLVVRAVVRKPFDIDAFIATLTGIVSRP